MVFFLCHRQNLLNVCCNTISIFLRVKVKLHLSFDVKSLLRHFLRAFLYWYIQAPLYSISRWLRKRFFMHLCLLCPSLCFQCSGCLLCYCLLFDRWCNLTCKTSYLPQNDSPIITPKVGNHERYVVLDVNMFSPKCFPFFYEQL